MDGLKLQSKPRNKAVTLKSLVIQTSHGLEQPTALISHVFFNFVEFVVPVCCGFQRCYYALIMRDEVVHLLLVFCAEQAVAESRRLQTLQL